MGKLISCVEAIKGLLNGELSKFYNFIFIIYYHKYMLVLKQSDNTNLAILATSLVMISQGKPSKVLSY